MDALLDCEIYRRFGVEVEVNTPSGEIKKLSKNEAPEGAQYIANIVNKITTQRVEVHGWHSTHNNNCWVVKPDSSCGVEICTPILKGWTGLKLLLNVIDSVHKHVGIDSRCSLHLHVNVEDLDREEIGNILAWWIKCEPVFMDAMVEPRKCNRYCKLIGMCDLFRVEEEYDPYFLVESLADEKYFSVNTFHLAKDKRKTIEFRFMGHEGCVNPYTAKNWIRLLLHFVESAIMNEYPSPYEAGNHWSSLCWLDPIDVYNFLGFNNSQYLSAGLKQVRNWLTYRLMTNTRTTRLPGIWSAKGRKIALEQIDTLYQGETLPSSQNMHEELYSERYAI
jgi:hypothetical protein